MDPALGHCFLKCQPAVLGEKIFVRLGPHADLFGKLVGTFAGEQDVLGAFHHEAGEFDRVLDVFDKCDCTGLEPCRP